MKAGIDCGTSLTKFAWLDQGRLQLFSTANAKAESILDEMRAAGVKCARLTGIGAEPMAGDIIAERNLEDPIADEIALQAAGVRRLLGDTAPDEFLLVSIGTGTSYTFVTKDGAERHPLGNAIGGGLVNGFASLAMNPIATVSELALRGKPLDIFVRDLVPAAADTPQGGFVVSHFAKALCDSTDEDIYASILHLVAVTVIRDIMLFQMGRPVPSDVVFIGSPVSGFEPLRNYLRDYAALTGRIAHFPQKGEYAAAVGALYAD